MTLSSKLFDLSGKVAIITGGAGMLGGAFAEALASAGCRVVVGDLRQDAARTTAERVSKTTDVDVVGMALDVTDRVSVAALVNEVVRQFGRVDILVNNAAMTARQGSNDMAGYLAPVEEYPQEAWDRAIAVNLTGPFLCAQAVGPVMIRQGGGSVINISSIYGLVAPDQRIYVGTQNPYRPGESIYMPPPYPVTKGALLALNRYLATYWAGKNVRVNALTPGGVQESHDERFVQNYSDRTVLGRMATVDDYKGAILFLASDASRYMTGAVLVVDGGWTAW
jgi:NAD(P)-dependent dehydrogenase (short-subunit alcohol dehydrogenase family)